jgi:hypothetical protein
MDGQNQLFMHNVANYLANHSIIVPTDFSDNHGGRGLTSGQVYTFDLQLMAPGAHVNVQGAASLVILTAMTHRGRAVGWLTRGINAMWLAGPPMNGVSHANLPVGVNYVFTESLGGCSVYVDVNGGQITHTYAGVVPAHVPPHPQVTHPYPGTAANFDQTCGVAYVGGGVWNVGVSVPHDVGPFHRTHAPTGYRYLGY